MSSPVHVRWTSPAYTVLDPGLLDTLRPLAATAAAAAFAEAERRVRRLNTHRRAPDADVLDLGSASHQQAEHWMDATLGKARHPGAGGDVVVSWDQHSAVLTTWGTFAPHWPTFFRPGEDVAVFPPSDGDWVLHYHHSDKLFLG